MKFFDRLSDAVGSKMQLRFRDRAGAGTVLAMVLKGTVKDKDILVMGIPRGGVVVADIVASKLKADFDIVIARKLASPENKENAIGAVMPDGSVYLDEFMVNSLKISPEYIEKEKQEQLKEIQRRTELYRPRNQGYKIRDRTVILVDDGIATGATVIAAARWIRKQKPKQLIIAAPVAQLQSKDLLRAEADKLEVVSTPSNFGSVQQFYQDFVQLNDELVIGILKARKFV